MGSILGQLRKAFGVFIKSIKDMYNYLGTVLMTSGLWFLWFVLATMVASIFTRSLWGILAIAMVLTSPATTAAFYVVNLVLRRNDIGLRDFGVGIRRFLGRSLGISLFHVLVSVILVADLIFFFTNKNAVIRVASGIWLYALLFVMMMLNYYHSLLVQQETTVLKAAKRAALLVLDNLFFSLAVSFFALVITAVSVVLAPAFALLFMGTLGFLENNALIELFKKYGIYEEPEDELLLDDGEFGNERENAGQEGGSVL